MKQRGERLVTILLALSALLFGTLYGNILAVTLEYISIRNQDDSLPAILIISSVVALTMSLIAWKVRHRAKMIISWFLVASSASCLVSLSGHEDAWYWDMSGTKVTITSVDAMDSGGLAWGSDMQINIDDNWQMTLQGGRQDNSRRIRWEIRGQRELTATSLGRGCTQTPGASLVIECEGPGDTVAVIPHALTPQALSGGKVAIAVQLGESRNGPTHGVDVNFTTWDYLGSRSDWRFGSILAGSGTAEYGAVRFSQAEGPQTLAIELRNPQGISVLNMIQQICLIVVGGAVTISLLPGRPSRIHEDAP